MESSNDQPPVVATFRSAAKGIAKNTSIMMFQQVITMGSSVLLTIFLARYLGPVEYGKLYLAASLFAIFQIFVNYGGNYVIAKEVARTPEHTGRIFVNALVVRLCFAALSYLIIWIIAFVAGFEADVQRLLTIYGLGLFIWAAHTSLYACFQGHEQLQYTSLGAIVERVFTSTVAIAALLLGAGAAVIVVIILLGILGNVAIEAWYSKKIIRQIPRLEWGGVFHGLREGAPYFLFGLFSSIYYRVGTVMLSKMSTQEAVGWFGAAFRFFESMNFPYVLTVAIYPVLSRSWVDVSDVHKLTMQRSLAYVFVLGVPVSVGTILFAREIIGIFYGIPAYEPSVLVLQILAGGLVLLYIDMILGTALLSSDRQKKLVMIAVMTIPINLALNALLIPYFQLNFQNGGLGVALATGITEVVVMTSMLRLLPTGVLIGFPTRLPVKALLAGACMAIVALSVRAVGGHWVLAAIISSIAYVAGILGLRTFQQSELAFAREFVRNWFGRRGSDRDLPE